MAGYDPNLMSQARASMGLPALGGVQPLTPDEQALGQAQADQLAAQDAYVAANQAHQPEMLPPAMQPQAFAAPIPLDWQPSQPQVQQPAPAIAPPQPAPTPVRVPGAGGDIRAGAGPANPLGGMLSDATKRREAADAARTQAGIDADMALEGQALGNEQLGAIRQRVAEQTGANRREAAAADAEAQRKMDDAYDSHLKATEKTSARKREVDDYIGNYQVKDRRGTMQKAMGAIAVATGMLVDQVNLVAGLNAGQNIQTNRGAMSMELINRQIDRDLEAQREMLANKRTQSAALGTELGQAQARWGDTKEALLTARQLKLDQFEKSLEAIKAQGASEESSVLADQTIDAIRMQKAQIDEQRAQSDYEKAFNDEQRFKQVQYAQTMAGRPRTPTTKEALELEGKALDNAKKRQELGQAPATKLTADQQKVASFLKGYESSARTLAQAVASGEGAPGVLERNVPDVFRSTGALAAETAENAMIEADLRIESGASISDGDIAAKRRSMGLDSSDPSIRLAARRKLLESHNAKREGLGLDPMAPVVRRGAAQ